MKKTPCLKSDEAIRLVLTGQYVCKIIKRLEDSDRVRMDIGL